MLIKWFDFIKEFSLSKDFSVSYDDILECVYYITDEFPELDVYIEGSQHSSIIEYDKNSFIIELLNPNNFGDGLYYLEPKIFSLIEDVNNQLSKFGLKVFASDFGSTDAYYELVITKIGNELTYKKSK
jgi:hypothetical protein